MKWLARVLIVVLVFVGNLGFAEEIIKHRETVQVGAYQLEVGFSQYPLQAERSLDITFTPVGGIQDLSGSTKMTLNGGEHVIKQDLVRFTKDRTIWGYDLISIPKKGIWHLEFVINGKQGKGVGNLKLEVLERPAGPSVALTQPLGLIPILAVLILATRAWWRVRPTRHAEANQW
jgi:hypothetical protein